VGFFVFLLDPRGGSVTKERGYVTRRFNPKAFGLGIALRHPPIRTWKHLPTYPARGWKQFLRPGSIARATRLPTRASALCLGRSSEPSS